MRLWYITGIYLLNKNLCSRFIWNPPPKNAKIQLSEKKANVNGFLGCWTSLAYWISICRGSTINYLEEGPTFLSTKILLLHDNCRDHKANKVIELRDQLYSFSLALSDLFLFKNLQKYHRGTRFTFYEEPNCRKILFRVGKNILEVWDNWKKCISVEGR